MEKYRSGISMTMNIGIPPALSQIVNSSVKRSAMMKATLLMLYVTIITIPLNGQDENIKNITGGNTAYSLLYTGAEFSTTSYIDTKTRDSNSVHLYISPYVDYYNKTGLGCRAKTYLFADGSNPGFFLSSVTPYYARYTGLLFPYISYTRYFYNDNPSVPYSPIENDVYAHIRINTNPVNVRAGLDYGFGRDKENNNEPVNDITVFAGLSKVFQKNMGMDNVSIAVIPSLELNAGTDRYFKYTRTSRYISQNRTVNGLTYGKGRGQGSGSMNSGSTETGPVITTANNFSLSNLEVNLYTVLFMGNFTIEPSGSLYIPLRNGNTVTGYWMITLGALIN